MAAPHPVGDDRGAPDVLGDGWTARTLPLRPDARQRAGAPPPAATLVSPTVAATDPARTAVLYLHGFTDYFFHDHVGAALAERGYDLHALDLRDHGRSIRPGRPPSTTTDLAGYTEEIDAAVRLLRDRYDHLVLLGHSTGGLVAALWADSRRGLGLVDALVLNSPWLDLRGPWWQRSLLTPVLDVVGRVRPGLVVRHLAPHYATALHVEGGGEWAFDPAWKPFGGFPVHAGFIRSVRRGHARVARGLAVDVPVLVLASDRTGPDHRFHDELLSTDSVLDAEQMAVRAPRLGPDVTLVRVAGGAHDLALSPLPARRAYLDAVLDFLDRHVPHGRSSAPGGRSITG